MSRPKPIRIIDFVREDSRGSRSCQILVYAGGSAYVAGDDVEMIIEDCPDAIAKAVKHVEAHGYTRRDRES